MADTRDLKSLAEFSACGFESRSWHQPDVFLSVDGLWFPDDFVIIVGP